MPTMTPEKWQQVVAILDQARGCEPNGRSALIEDLCSGDPEMRAEVLSLLRYENVRAPIVDDETLPASIRTAEADDPEGTRIGPYRLLERLGAGGMGTVFLAAREDDFHKLVALKRVQRRRDSPDLRHRFETERQILAGLEHPNIARILDGGTTDGDEPYFVMEYVEGQPIDTYCDEQRLGLRKRIQLFIAVCLALQTAHRNLVVHRDIKPSNILVTKDGMPKLIDFGIAKHLDDEAGETEAEQQPMTYSFASPEQIQNEEATASTDIYALGVVLYRLLCGREPYRFDGSLLGLCNAISYQNPEAPSLAIGRDVVGARSGKRQTEPEEIARVRSSKVSKLVSDLSGDIDHIVLRCLSKRPEDRYASVEHLADDLRRYLGNRPVAAREGAFGYVTAKLARRHWKAISALGLLAIISLGAAVMLFLLRQQIDQRASEQAISRELAQRTAEILADLIEFVDPDQCEYAPQTVELIDDARRKITSDLRKDPNLLAQLLKEPIARVYRRAGYLNRARAVLSEALATLRSTGEPDGPEVAAVLNDLGGIHYRQGNYAEARERWQECIDLYDRLGIDGQPLIGPLANLAALLGHEGFYEGAAQLYRRALAIVRTLPEAERTQEVRLLISFGMLHYLYARPSLALPLLHEALELELDAEEGASSLAVASIRSSLGRLLLALDDVVGAEIQLQTALDIRRQRLSAGHPDLARTYRNLAAVMIERGELATAEVLLERAQSVLREIKPADDWELAELEGWIGAYRLALADPVGAEPCLRESHRRLEETRGSETIYTRLAAERLAALEDLARP